LRFLRSVAGDGSIGCMLLSFAYLTFSAVLRLLLRRRSSEFAKDIELLVLRHRLTVSGVRPSRAAAVGSISRADRPAGRLGSGSCSACRGPGR
jgi:hypothetical protein